MRLLALAAVGAFALAASTWPSLADIGAAVPEQSATVADETAPTATPANPTADNRMVCKATGTTGSRLPIQRICKTQKQWDDIRAEDEKNLDKAQLLRGTPPSN